MDGEDLLEMATNERLGGKYARAVVLLDEFRRAESAFIHKKATVAKPGVGGSLLIEVQAIPVLLSAIAGDFLQDLRSSLDHEVYRITEKFKGKGWSGLEGCGFPIRRDKGRYVSERQTLIGNLPKHVKEVIEAIHPSSSPRMRRPGTWTC